MTGAMCPASGHEARFGQCPDAQKDTTRGGQIILTADEVALHQDKFPDNALAIVSIALSRDASGPKCSGGVLVVYQPWAIAKGDLNPISYRYTTSLTEGV